MKRSKSRLRMTLALFAGIGMITVVLGVGSTRAAEVVDLRGYGKVQASITPQRSEFVCESAEKADILLGKLLADLFWDAGADHTVTTVKLGNRDAVVHQWPPYGALIAGRKGNRVVVVGGQDAPEVAARASQEALLTAAEAVFAPVKPYPKYLDCYDLGAVSCYTLGLEWENKFRYQERAAFTKQFFPGGLSGQMNFFQRTPAEDIYRILSSLDTDIHLAEQENQMFSVAIGTGSWPAWAEDKWPGYVDRPSPLHLDNQSLTYPPEALGMSLDQRRHTSLKLLYDVIHRYQSSPVLGSLQLYVGDYLYETYFGKSAQGHWGYTAVGLAAFRHWLRDVRGYSLATLGQRWFGDAGHFSSWNDVSLPDPDEFFGDLKADCLRLSAGWFWKQAEPGQFERPAPDAPGWVPVPRPPSQQMLALPGGPAFWRITFDPTLWLQKNVGKEVYLVCNVDNMGWRRTTVWLNGVNLGEHTSKVNPLFGPFGLRLTGLLQPGPNQVCLQVTGDSGSLPGPVFLTTTRPVAYPYLGEQRNAQYVDALEWRLSALNAKVTDAMAYARSLDPDRPFVLPATSHEVADGQGEALRRYGGSMQDTGYESSYRPLYSRLGYAAGFYGSCEQAGIADIAHPAAYVTTLTRRLSWMLQNAEGMYLEWRDPYCYYQVEKQTGWFTQNQRRYQLFGKYLPEKPQIALLDSSESALLGYEGHSMWDWNLGRGELQASHYDNVYVTESMLAQGLADEYPVLFDADTLTMTPELIAALRRYVEKGGTFIATQNSGRHSLLEPDTWPISELTGFKVLAVGRKGTIRFENNLPIFHGWEGKQFEGEGSALDWKDTQSAKHVSVALAPQASDTVALARWEDGTVAVGMRKLGQGRVIVLGSTFWRYGRDLGGTGMYRITQVEPAFFERLFTDLGVKRTDDASTPDVYTRKVITKNGLQEWLIAMNTLGTDTTADLSFAVAAPPAQVWDMDARGRADEKTPVAFTYADGWVRIKGVTLPPYATAIYGVQRGSLSAGLAFWWGEKTKFWTRRTPLTPAVEPPKEDSANPPTISFDAWKFYADRDGAVSQTDDWVSPAFADATWRTADNEPWNLQFEDLKDYGAVGLYRSRPFALPAGWKNRRITVDLDGARGYTWSSFDLYLNGQKVPALDHPYWKVDVTDQLKSAGNVLCVKLTGKQPGGDFPLSGLEGLAIWLQPELTLAPSLSLLGAWQAVQGDWVTTQTVTLTGIPTKLTDQGVMKPGITAVKANHLMRDVEIPAAWRGKSVYLHIVSPMMRGETHTTGVGLGMVIINGQARLLDQRPNIPLDQMVNVTPYLKFGETNRIELWTRNTSRGSMLEENLVINDLALGCGAG